MNSRLLALTALTAPFVAFTTFAVWEHGYVAIFTSALASSSSMQVFLDLSIALVLVCGWIWADAPKRGLSPWPWLLATPLLGSIAPLGYLWVRELRAPGREGRSRGAGPDVIAA